jgi:hypothetical protein
MVTIHSNREGWFANDDENGATTVYYASRDALREALAHDEAEFSYSNGFTLRNDPPAPKRARFDDEPTRQRVLVEGMDCLPGQLDLF